MRGTVWSSEERPGGTVPGDKLMSLLSDVNTNIWYEQAQIAYSSAIDRDFPLIDNPRSSGCPGAASVSISESTGGEAEEAAELCVSAWEDKYPGRTGQPIVIVRATCPNGPGAARGAPNELKIGAARGNDLCRAPRNLLESDFANPARELFTVVLEPGPLGGDAFVRVGAGA